MKVTFDIKGRGHLLQDMNTSKVQYVGVAKIHEKYDGKNIAA